MSIATGATGGKKIKNVPNPEEVEQQFCLFLCMQSKFPVFSSS